MVIVLVHDSARALIDFKIFSKPPGYHHLPFYGEHHSVSFRRWIHGSEYYLSEKSKSNGIFVGNYDDGKPLQGG